jgi:hypothetical protein
MAKDPAFLFYTGDFSTGTQFFTDEQVGKFLRILMAQHQHGHLTEQQMIFICKSYDKEVFSKFIKDEQGLYFNIRLEFEVNKRRSFSESRSKNKIGKTKIISKSYDNHMENKNKNKNKNEIIIGKEGVGEKLKLPFQEIIDIFNSVCIDLPNVEKLTESRKKLIEKRVKENSLEILGEVFKKVNDSDFLSGRKTDWKANFDWIMNPTNFVKILEDNYKNKTDEKRQQEPLFGRQDRDTFIANATGWDNP